jgi:asparagine synthase (glutamine-hydrolysing)
MCGISGIVGDCDKATIRKMVEIQTHRGPDDKGFFLDKGVGLGHNRLSVIDLSTGHQPIYNEDKSICTIFNGEIYNYKVLKAELELRGHKFYTNSDTECLVHLYEEEGENMARFLDGMFAFAIWDSVKRQLLLARDRIGKKPLYYTMADGRFIFASEIKAILTAANMKREVDKEALSYFMHFGYVPTEKTLFKDVFKIPAASTLIYNTKMNRPRITQFWKLQINEKAYAPEHAYMEKFQNLFEESVKKRLMSDVPFGLFLSGGMDSSSIAVVMKKYISRPLMTFSVGFEGAGDDESNFANMVAEHVGTDHNKLTLKYDAMRALPKVVWHMDEPLADAASVAFYHLSEFAQKKIKVCMIGEGGDEMLGGYKSHMITNIAAKYGCKIPLAIRNSIASRSKSLNEHIPVESRLKRYTHFAAQLSNLEPTEVYRNLNVGLDEDAKDWTDYSDDTASKRLCNTFFNNGMKPLNQILLFETNVQLPNYLLMKADKCTMAKSIEARVPFLDYKLVEFSASMPHNLKIRGFTTKYILRRAMKDELPKEILKRPKHPFVIPVIEWINKGLDDIVPNLLSEQTFRKRGYFNYKKIERLLGSKKNYGMLWPLLLFEIWHRSFIDREEIEKPLDIEKML